MYEGYPYPAGVWRAPWLTRQIHGLPHLNFSLHPVNPYYNPEYDDYRSSIILLSMVPFYTAIYVLCMFFCVRSYAVPANRCPKADCLCVHEKWIRTFTYGALLAFVLAFIFELVMHQQVSAVIEADFSLPQETLDIYDHGRQYDYEKASLSFRNLMRYNWARSAFRRVDRNWNKNQLTYPYRLQLGRYVQEMQIGLTTQQTPEVTPVKLHSQRVIDFRDYETLRFILKLFAWVFSFYTALCRPICCLKIRALMGVIWCCLLGGYLMHAMMSIADICIFPGIYIRRYLNHTVMYNETKEKIKVLCKNFNDSIKDGKPFCNATTEKWLKIFKAHALNIMSNHQSNMQGPGLNYAAINADPRYLYTQVAQSHLDAAVKQKYCKSLTDGKKGLDCKKQAKDFNEIITPRENFLPLCEGDAVLRWAFLQFMAVYVALFLFMFILMLAYRIQTCRGRASHHQVPCCIPTCGVVERKPIRPPFLRGNSCKIKKPKRLKPVKDEGPRCKCVHRTPQSERLVEAARQTGGRDVLIVDLDDNQKMLLLTERQ